MRICDGCQRSEAECKRAGDGELKICPDCQYAACEDCQCHGCTAGDRCAGVGECHCGSCKSELSRIRNPELQHRWMQRPVGLRGIKDVGEVRFHHNLARGTCRCPNTNFGGSYMDMPDYRKLAHRQPANDCYKGAKGGEPYRGPRKSNAQIERERCLMDLSRADEDEVRTCGHQKCAQPGTLRCERCKSEFYCSASCQRAAWGVHKCDCGVFVPSRDWPFVTKDLQQFHKKHGHYPGEGKGPSAISPGPAAAPSHSGNSEGVSSPMERALAALAAEDAAGAEPLAKGARVRVHGLVKTSRYNGCTAVVQSVMDNGRVCVLLDMPQGKEISIKAENAVVIPRAEAAGAPDGGRGGEERAGAAGLKDMDTGHSHIRLQEIYSQFGYCHDRMLKRLEELYHARDWRKMAQLEGEALEFAEQVRALQPGIAGDLYSRFGYCHDRMGEYDRAIELHQQHRALAGEAGDLEDMAGSLNNEGNCWKSLAKFETAIEMYEKAKALHGRVGDRIGLAQNLDNIGLCLQKMGQQAKAITLHEEAWRMSTDDASDMGQMRAALWLGSALWAQVLVLHYNGRAAESRRMLSDAEKWLGKALKLGEEHAVNFQRDAQLYLACVAFFKGNEEEAVGLLGKHLHMWMDLGRHHCSGCMQVRGNDAPMLTCNGCRVARYCNLPRTGATAMSCQKMAWKNLGSYDQAVRHRDICPLLKINHLMAKEDEEERKMKVFGSLYVEMVGFLRRATAGLPDGKVWLA